MTITSSNRIELAKQRREHALARARQEEPPLGDEYEDYMRPQRRNDLTLMDVLSMTATKQTKPKQNKPKFSNTQPRII